MVCLWCTVMLYVFVMNSCFQHALEQSGHKSTLLISDQLDPGSQFDFVTFVTVFYGRRVQRWPRNSIF